MNDKDKQQVCGCMVMLGCIECGNMMSASCLEYSLQIQDNADVLLDSGLKLSDIVVTLCSKLLGGLSLHLNHLIASRMTNYDWPFGTLPFRLFGSNLDTRDLEIYPTTYSGHF